MKNKTLVSTTLPNENDSTLLSNSNSNTPIRYINPNSMANGMKPMQQQFSNFTLNRHFELAKNQVISDRDFNEANKNTGNNNNSHNEEMNKIFPDTNFRLSDLFNDLSSPNCNTNATYTTPLNNYQQASSLNSSQMYNKLNASSSPKQANTFQSYPSFVSSPKQIVTSPQTPSNNANNNSCSTLLTPPPPPLPPSSSRQLLLLQTAASQMNNSNSPNLVNKFPNPFMQHHQQPTANSGTNAITSKFYNNFYRNPINKANV